MKPAKRRDKQDNRSTELTTKSCKSCHLNRLAEAERDNTSRLMKIADIIRA